MRISDWSSDVCSSDLSSGSGWPMATERTKPLDEIDRRILHALQEDARLTIAEVAERVGLSSTPCWNRIRRLEEIGRASCRERVCQSVEISVVAVSLKKNNQKQS